MNELTEILEVLIFYADPDTYFAIGFLPDPPNGDFMDDFSETEELGYKPGKRARELLTKYRDFDSGLESRLIALVNEARCIGQMDGSNCSPREFETCDRRIREIVDELRRLIATTVNLDPI